MQYAIVTDLNRCVGCLACSVACKVQNPTPIGSFRLRVLRFAAPKYEGAVAPDVDMYFLPVTCQHCANPTCIEVCPTGASFKDENGIVRIDEETCIGCESCIPACPYSVRFLNEETGTVQKCSLCAEKVDEGLLPQCVVQCSARARFFGNIEQGIENMVAPADMQRFWESGDKSYEASDSTRERFADYATPITDEDVHYFTDEGNGPSFAYIVRGKEWQMLENGVIR